MLRGPSYLCLSKKFILMICGMYANYEVLFFAPPPMYQINGI